MAILNRAQEQNKRENNGNQQKQGKQDTVESILGAKLSPFTHSVSVYVPTESISLLQGTTLAVKLENAFSGEVFCQNITQLMSDKHGAKSWREITAITVHFGAKGFTVDAYKSLRKTVQAFCLVLNMSSLVVVCDGSMFLVNAE